MSRVTQRMHRTTSGFLGGREYGGLNVYAVLQAHGIFSVLGWLLPEPGQRRSRSEGGSANGAENPEQFATFGIA